VVLCQLNITPALPATIMQGWKWR